MTLTEHWVRVYTSGLPEQVRARRVDEIISDLHDQLAEAGAAGVRQARRSVVGRTVRGAVDDLVWRREVGREMDSSRGLRAAVSQAWWAPVAALVVVFDVGFAAAVLADDGSTMPGRVVGPALVLAAALALVVGLGVRLGATGGPTRRRVLPVAVIVVGAALAAVGIGGPIVLVVAALSTVIAAAALLRGSVRSRAVADGLILLGTLPALAMFWMVVPPVLAVVVVAGVLTSGTRTATAAA